MVAYLWSKTHALFAGLGRFGLLMASAFRQVGHLRLYYRNLVAQFVRVGIDSLPIVALASAFTGAVAAVQSIYQLEGSFYLPKTAVGSFVTTSVILELGALIAAFILAGRVGARIAAELGTMRVTEQIDALEAMGLNSASYLVLPRIIAGVLMFPVIYVVACTVGIGMGVIVGEATGVISTQTFVDGARLLFRPYDVFFGVVKSLSFGFAITSVSCYFGYFTTGGAEGVGQSTTKATVMSCVFVLLADYVLAVLML
jgi:phospholipid/cholesterol/gamma-HCH transport system permease protein